jgi:hypothetical protein
MALALVMSPRLRLQHAMYSTHKLEECHTMYDMHAKKKVEISIDQEWTFIIN